MDENYYDKIFESYDTLYSLEQNAKLNLAKILIKKYYQINDDTKIIDFGCGSGFSSNFNCFVTGLDNSNKLLSLAKKRYLQDKRKEFVFFDVNATDKFEFNDGFFDICISLSAFHHFNNFELVLREIKRITSKLILISIPNRVTRFKEYDDNLVRAIAISGLKLVNVVDDNVDRFYVILK